MQVISTYPRECEPRDTVVFDKSRSRRDRASRLLAERRALFAEIVLDVVPEPLIVLDQTNAILCINRAAEQAFGYAEVDTIGKPIDFLLSSNRATDERFGKRRDGSLFPAQVSAQVMDSELGPMQALLVRDVTAEREQQRGQEEFFVHASHELRTPVTTLLASADVLLEALPADASEVAHRMVSNIQREAERLATLVDDLLDLNSIRAGRINLKLTVCDLRAVVEGAVLAMEALARRRDQRLEIHLPPAPIPAHVDAGLFGRAVLNLISNACKYGREGGHIDVWVQTTQDVATVSVCDDGPGIPEADRERVFERFYRAPTAEGRRIQGNGLGLPLCRAAVEMHGGRVSAHAAPGGGSTFRIVIPLGQATASAACES
jgi:signal transduction histidine kinase